MTGLRPLPGEASGVEPGSGLVGAVADLLRGNDGTLVSVATLLIHLSRGWAVHGQRGPVRTL
jgi:hypothetical protein